MKNNLGKIIILILIFININASEYRWSASINKQKAYIFEAVHLHYSCEFNSRDELYVIEFNPVGSYKDYDIYLLSESENIVDGKRVNNFEFVAFVKESGLIEFNFDVMMKKTNQDSIENTVLGRDNTEFEQFSKKLIKQKTLSIDVKENSKKLVGEFKFLIKKDEVSLNSYEPFHYELIVEGVGNLDKIKPLDINISDTKVFTSKPKRNYILTKDGYKGRWSQKFAIVSKESFEFPSISYEYFDVIAKTLKSYSMDKFVVDIKELYKKEELLDLEDESRFVYKKEYLYYIFVFIAGFLVGRIKLHKADVSSQDKLFNEKIDLCKSLDELLLLLIINGSVKFANLIKMIESKQVSLQEAKILAKK